MLSISTLPVKGEESLETSTREERETRQLNTASSLGTVPPDKPTTPILKPAVLALGWLST